MAKKKAATTPRTPVAPALSQPTSARLPFLTPTPAQRGRGMDNAAVRQDVQDLRQYNASQMRRPMTLDGIFNPGSGETDTEGVLASRGAGPEGGSGGGSGGGGYEGPLTSTTPEGLPRSAQAGMRQNADGSRTYVPPARQPQAPGRTQMGDIGTVFANAAPTLQDRNISQQMGQQLQQSMTPEQYQHVQRNADFMAAQALPGRFGQEAMDAVNHYPGASGHEGYKPVSQTYRQGFQQAQDAGLNLNSNKVQQAVLGQMSLPWGSPATAGGRQMLSQAGQLSTEQLKPMVEQDIRFAPAYAQAQRRELEQKSQADQRLLDRQLATWGLRGQTATQVQQLKNQGGTAVQGLKNEGASTVQDKRNTGRVQYAEVRNQGNAQVQGMRNDGQMKVQGLRNDGSLATQGARNQGAVQVQGMRGQSATQVQGMRNQSAAQVQGMRNQGTVEAATLRNQGATDRAYIKNSRAKAPNPLQGLVQSTFSRWGNMPQRESIQENPTPAPVAAPQGGVLDYLGIGQGGQAAPMDPQFNAIPPADRQMLDSVPPQVREAKAQQLEAAGHPVAAAYLRSR